MQRLGAKLDSAERRMVVPLGRRRRRCRDAAPACVVATDADHDTVVAIIGEEYSDYPDERRLVGIDAGRVVGTLRLTGSAQRTMIYGFVIDERRRGQRLGTRMLAPVMASCAPRVSQRSALRSIQTNTPAVRLYERFGFKTVTTYRYMCLAITPPALPDPAPAQEPRAGALSPEA